MFKDPRLLHVLIVEDNPGDLILIEEYLSDQFGNAHITSADNLASAKRVMHTSDPAFDVILLDLSLPDKSGENLLREVHSICAGALIIVLTGYADVSFSIRALAMGASDYLVKDDINALALYKSIVYNIERHKLNQQLAESEKRFSNLFHLSPQPMWVFDPTTLGIVQVNFSAVQLYGYTESEFLNLTIMDIRPPEDRAKVSEALNKRPLAALIAGEVFRHRRKNGEIFFVEIYSSPINLNNKLYRSVIAIDVTEKTLINHQITKAIIKTQEDERYEIGGELHDNVCQLLATSQMLMGMLARSMDPSGTRIYEQCKRYLSLALDDIRKISHRLAPTFFENTPMEEVFRTLAKNSNLGAASQVDFHFSTTVTQYSPSKEIQINLYRILQEQLRNINKHARASQISIAVDIRDENLEMKVSDNGIGFDPGEVRDGIGMANMRRRAELFSGKMQVEAAPGKGCTIVIGIPLQKVVPSASGFTTSKDSPI
jgi:PAS domain S-box-containing protein